MEVEEALYGLYLRGPDCDQAVMVTDRYHTVRGTATHLEVPTIWMVPERVDDRIVVGINERFVLLAGERESARAAWDRAKRYRRRIRNEERRHGTMQVGIGAYPAMSSEPVDAVRLERCRAHAEWIAERAQGAVAQRAAALLKTLSEGGGKGEAEEARRRFEELAEGCAQGHDTPYIGAAWVGQNAYLEIVAMGEAALPMLLERVRTEPREWLPALEAITGQRWEAEDAAFEDRVRFWREWGREQGYLSPRSGDGNSNGE